MRSVGHCPVTIARIPHGYNPRRRCEFGENSRPQWKLYHGDDCCRIIPGTGADSGFQEAADLIGSLS